MTRVALTKKELIQIAEKLGGHGYTDQTSSLTLIEHIAYLATNNVDYLIV